MNGIVFGVAIIIVNEVVYAGILAVLALVRIRVQKAPVVTRVANTIAVEALRYLWTRFETATQKHRTGGTDRTRFVPVGCPWSSHFSLDAGLA
jgi:hypothetical protein